jgi:cytochrome c oxidase subunit 4
VITIRSAVLTYIGLIVLVLLTVGSIFIPLGVGNSLINLAIAVAKAALIGAVFMHLRKPLPLAAMSIFVLLFWLCLMYGFTLSDYATR